MAQLVDLADCCLFHVASWHFCMIRAIFILNQPCCLLLVWMLDVDLKYYQKDINPPENFNSKLNHHAWHDTEMNPLENGNSKLNHVSRHDTVQIYPRIKNQLTMLSSIILLLNFIWWQMFETVFFKIIIWVPKNDSSISGYNLCLMSFRHVPLSWSGHVWKLFYPELHAWCTPATNARCRCNKVGTGSFLCNQDFLVEGSPSRTIPLWRRAYGRVFIY